MTPEERLVRLENAFSTLAELAKKESERTDEYKRRTEELAELARMQNRRLGESERQTAELAELIKTQDKRLVESERRTEILIELARVQSERMDEYERRTEDFHQRMEEIAELQKQTGANLSALTEIVADLGRAQRRTEEKLAETDEQLRALAATVDRHIESKGGRG